MQLFKMLRIAALVYWFIANIVNGVQDGTFELDLSNKMTWQSSVYSEQTRSYPSNLAVDGCLEPYFSYGCCSSTDTDDDSNPWWTIDLEKPYTVTIVGLTNRADGLGYKLAEFHVYGSNTSKNPSEDPYKKTCLYREESISEGDTEYMHCDGHFTARFIIIQKSEPILTLCEVFLTAEYPYNTYGSNCDDCPTTCAYPPCHRGTGACVGGCLEGYTGDNCSKQCSSNTYGENCQPCSTQCLMQPCDLDTGACPNGECQSGYQGHNCTQECPLGMYGANCQSNCAENCKSGCDHVSGVCHQGCVDGWTGDMCDKEKSGLSAGEIAAIVVVLLLVFIGVVIAVTVFIIIKKRRKQTGSDKVVNMAESPSPPVTNGNQNRGEMYEHPVRNSSDIEHPYTAVF